MKSTTDVWFIAFLLSKKYPMQSYTVLSRGKVRCDFDMTEDEWKQNKLEFQRSEIVQFKSLLQQVKDLAF